MGLSSRELADFALDTSTDDFDDELVRQAELRVLDSMGCAVGAFAGDSSKALRECFGDRRGGREATILGSDDSVSVEHAAFVNAAMVRYLDFNDCYTNRHGGGHPSDHVPGLLAVAEAHGASGRELLEAVVVAYEIQCRGLASGVVYRHDFDAQSVWGAYSATAAVGKLMGLSVAELVDAIGICGASSNGLLIARRGDVSMWKGAAMPYVVHGAVEACQMAEHGVTGPERLFDGSGGVFEVVSRGEFDLPLAADGYELSRTAIKPYAGCYHALPAVTGLLELFEAHDIAVGDVAEIEVGVYETATRTCATPEKWDRELTRETADHSLPYMLAVAALEGDIRPEHYDREWLTSDAVHGVMDRIAVETDPDLTARREGREGSTPTRVRVVADATYETTVDYPLGHPERPMSEDAVADKARSLVAPYLSDGQTDELVRRCLALSGESSVEPLVSAAVV